MNRADMHKHFGPVIALVRRMYPTDDLPISWAQDYGMTIGVAVLGKMLVVEAHAWSWDGNPQLDKVELFMTDGPPGQVLHLSDPMRPNLVVTLPGNELPGNVLA